MFSSCFVHRCLAAERSPPPPVCLEESAIKQMPLHCPKGQPREPGLAAAHLLNPSDAVPLMPLGGCVPTAPAIPLSHSLQPTSLSPHKLQEDVCTLSPCRTPAPRAPARPA